MSVNYRYLVLVEMDMIGRILYNCEILGYGFNILRLNNFCILRTQEISKEATTHSFSSIFTSLKPECGMKKENQNNLNETTYKKNDRKH